MIYYYQAMTQKGSPDFAAVRQQVPLESFFQNQLGDAGSHVPGRYSICPACGLTKAKNKVSVRNGFFKCFECGKNGDVIEAASLAFGVDKNKAAAQLVGADFLAIEFKVKAPVRERDYTAVSEVAKLLVQGQTLLSAPVEQYLKKRGVGQGALDSAFAAGLVRSLPSDNGGDCFRYLKDLIGKPTLERAGMLSGERQFAPASYRPLLFLAKDCEAMEFRLIRERKLEEAKVIRYGHKTPFFVEQNNEQLAVVEGAIDLLSAMELGVTSSLMGLPGANSWEIDWFMPWQGKVVTLALDNDDVGQKEAGALGEKLAAIGCVVKYYKPKGKDLNDELLQKINGG